MNMRIESEIFMYLKHILIIRVTILKIAVLRKTLLINLIDFLIAISNEIAFTNRGTYIIIFAPQNRNRTIM